MDFGLVAGGLVKAALPKVAGAIATAVKQKLNPTELQRSLEVGLRESGAFDVGQKINNAVFYHWEPGKTDKFLAALLEHPEVQRELQKPLEQDGAPDVAMLVQVAKHIAADLDLSIQDETLAPWVKAFANAYFDAITAIRFQVAKADYLEQLANWFDDVKFAGVAVPGQDVERAERLAQIFVMPDVEEEGGQRSRMVWERSAFEEQGEQGRQGELLQEQRMRSQLERSGRKFSAQQLLQQHQKKIVLLGAPGSGKTTLMSFFAVTLAGQQAIAKTSDAPTEGLSPDAMALSGDTMALSGDTKGLRPNTMALSPDTKGLSLDAMALSVTTKGLRSDTDDAATQPLPLPILIRIRDWALHPDQTIPEYARQFAEKTMHVKPLPKGFFEHWLDNGQALILLDGLDEVAEPSKRHHLVQCIENFLGQYPHNRAIITSRPAGYRRDFFRTEEFPHYELQPFDDKKIEEFCDRWYTSRVPDTAEAQRRKESLQKALNQQDRIKLLARNPLLLTIIALIHRYQARLPRERYKLYDKAVETLLTSWDSHKELSNQTVLKYLQLDDLRRLMEHLAYWIHTQGNTGDAEGGTLIDKDELIHQLTQEIKTLKQLQRYEAKEEAKRFVEFIRDRTGLLNEQGQDCYAFVHKTFQEYLTAQEINYQADNEDDFEIILTHIEQHLHDPHWREVLLLLIAQQSPKKAARAIRKVLTANSPYEQWLHRDLLFVGRCLAEDPKGVKGVDPNLSLEILRALIDLEVCTDLQISENVKALVFESLANLGETAFEGEALDLLGTNDQINKTRLRTYQFMLRSHRTEFEEKAELVSILVSLLKEDDYGKSFQSVLSLCLLCSEPEILTQALACEIEDADSSIRFRSANVLGVLGGKHGVVLQVLLNLLQSSDSSTRLYAARAIGFSGTTSEVAIQALLALLNDSGSEIHPQVVHALGQAGSHRKTDVQITQALIALLQTHNSEIRSAAAFHLGESSTPSELVIQALEYRLQDSCLQVQFDAARSLMKLGGSSELILEKFLALIQNPHFGMRFQCALAVGELGVDSEPAINVLSSLLGEIEPHVRCGAAWALVSLGSTSKQVVEILFSLINAEEFYIRHWACDALVKLGKAHNWILPAIVQWIEQHQDEACVGAGIDALWEIVEGKG